MNTQHNLFILMLCIILVCITISSVYADWGYYEGEIICSPSPIQVLVNEFIYKLDIPYPNEYPSDAEGAQISNATHQIIGGAVSADSNRNGWAISESTDNKTLADPDSPINAALTRGNISRYRPYILSSDIIDSNGDGRITELDTTVKEYFFGDAFSNISFVIVRETFNDIFTQYYSIYTTDKLTADIQSGSTIAYVYKTTLVWKRNLSISEINTGKYNISTSGSVKGICKADNAAVDLGNGNSEYQIFFNYLTFSQVQN